MADLPQDMYPTEEDSVAQQLDTVKHALAASHREAYYPHCNEFSLFPALAIVMGEAPAHWEALLPVYLPNQQVERGAEQRPTTTTSWRGILQRFVGDTKKALRLWYVEQSKGDGDLDEEGEGVVNVLEERIGAEGLHAEHEVGLIRLLSGRFGVALPSAHLSVDEEKKVNLQELHRTQQGCARFIEFAREQASNSSAPAAVQDQVLRSLEHVRATLHEGGVRTRSCDGGSTLITNNTFRNRHGVRVGLLGNVGVGKSTLINAVLGCDVSPVSAQGVGTARAVEFRHGDHDGFELTVHLLDPSQFHLLLRNYLECREALKEQCPHLRHYLDGRRKGLAVRGGRDNRGRDSGDSEEDRLVQLTPEQQGVKQLFDSTREALTDLFGLKPEESVLPIARRWKASPGALSVELLTNETTICPEDVYSAEEDAASEQRLDHILQMMSNQMLEFKYSDTKQLLAKLSLFAAGDRSQLPKSLGRHLLWPIVRKVVVTARRFPPGIVLVDIPGLQDDNDLRRHSSMLALRSCDRVWYVTSAVRALVQKGEREALLAVCAVGLLDHTKIIVHSPATAAGKLQGLYCRDSQEGLTSKLCSHLAGFLEDPELMCRRIPVVVVASNLPAESSEVSGVAFLRRELRLLYAQLARETERERDIVNRTQILIASLLDGCVPCGPTGRRGVTVPPPPYATREKHKQLRKALQLAVGNLLSLEESAAALDPHRVQVLEACHAALAVLHTVPHQTLRAVCRRAVKGDRFRDIDVIKSIVDAAEGPLVKCVTEFLENLKRVSVPQESVRAIVREIYPQRQLPAPRLEAPTDLFNCFEQVRTKHFKCHKDKLTAAVRKVCTPEFEGIRDDKLGRKFEERSRGTLALLEEKVAAALCDATAKLLQRASDEMRDAVKHYQADLVCRILKQMPDLLPAPLAPDARVWRADPLVCRLAQFWATTKQEVHANATVIKTEEDDEGLDPAEDTVAMPLRHGARLSQLSQAPSQLGRDGATQSQEQQHQHQQQQNQQQRQRPTDGCVRRSRGRSRSPSPPPPPKRRCCVAAVQILMCSRGVNAVQQRRRVRV